MLRIESNFVSNRISDDFESVWNLGSSSPTKVSKLMPAVVPETFDKHRPFANARKSEGKSKTNGDDMLTDQSYVATKRGRTRTTDSLRWSGCSIGTVKTANLTVCTDTSDAYNKSGKSSSSSTRRGKKKHHRGQRSRRNNHRSCSPTFLSRREEELQLDTKHDAAKNASDLPSPSRRHKKGHYSKTSHRQRNTSTYKRSKSVDDLQVSGDDEACVASYRRPKKERSRKKSSFPRHGTANTRSELRENLEEVPHSKEWKNDFVRSARSCTSRRLKKSNTRNGAIPESPDPRRRSRSVDVPRRHCLEEVNGDKEWKTGSVRSHRSCPTRRVRMANGKGSRHDRSQSPVSRRRSRSVEATGRRNRHLREGKNLKELEDESIRSSQTRITRRTKKASSKHDWQFRSESPVRSRSRSVEASRRRNRHHDNEHNPKILNPRTSRDGHKPSSSLKRRGYKLKAEELKMILMTAETLNLSPREGKLKKKREKYI